MGSLRSTAVWTLLFQLLNFPLPYAHSHESLDGNLLSSHQDARHGGHEEDHLHVHFFYLNRAGFPPKGSSSDPAIPFASLPDQHADLSWLELSELSAESSEHDSWLAVGCTCILDPQREFGGNSTFAFQLKTRLPFGRPSLVLRL